MGVLRCILAEEHPATSTADMKPERKEQVEQAFAKADKDSSRTLSVAEFKVAFMELADSDDKREKAKNEGVCEMIMGAVDGNGDQTITLEELMKLMNEEMDDELMLKNLVKNADKDGDGLISADEIRSMMMKIDPEDDDIDVMVNMTIRMCAHDETRKIKPEELISFMIDGPKERDTKEDAKRMFRMFDTDGDGYISKKELGAYFKEMMAVLDDDDDDDDSFINMMAKMMFASADEDKDGKLNYEEFTKMTE